MRSRFDRLGALVWALLAVSGPRSAAFEVFRASLHDEGAGALDVSALAELRGREKTLAERMLLRALPEPRAIVGLGALATRRAERALSRLFEEQCRARSAQDVGWSGATLIASALALWRIDGRPQCVEAIAERLRAAPTWGERMDAAAALAEMPIGEADLALTEALDDQDPLVRHHAARSLLAIHGVELDARATRYMVYRIMTGEGGRKIGGHDLAYELLIVPPVDSYFARMAER